MNLKLANSELIHFIGIGGIGMSGLASIMKNMGFNVQGSDLNFNPQILIRTRCFLIHALYNFVDIYIFK